VTSWLLSCEQEIVQEEEYERAVSRANRMALDHLRTVYVYEKFPDGKLEKYTEIHCIKLETARSEPRPEGKS